MSHNWTQFVRALLSEGRAKKPGPKYWLRPSERIGKALRRILRKRLPLGSVVESCATADSLGCSSGCEGCPYENGRVEVVQYPPDGSSGNIESGAWLHVVNRQVVDLEDYIKSFRSIEGEVCASRCEDLLFHTRRAFLGVIVHGPAIVWDYDVWSMVDPFTGRRVRGDQEGSPRTEAWVDMQTAQVVGIVSDCEEFLAVAEKMGLMAIKVSSAKSLYPPEYLEEPEDEFWDKAAQFDKDWA